MGVDDRGDFVLRQRISPNHPIVSQQPIGIGHRLVVTILRVGTLQREEYARAGLNVVVVVVGEPHRFLQGLGKSRAEIQLVHRRRTIVQPALHVCRVLVVVRAQRRSAILIDDRVEKVLLRVVVFVVPGECHPVDRRRVVPRRLHRIECRGLPGVQNPCRQDRLGQDRQDVRLLHVVPGNERPAGHRVPVGPRVGETSQIERPRRPAPLHRHRLRVDQLAERVTDLDSGHAHVLPVDGRVVDAPPGRQILHPGRDLRPVHQHAQVGQLRRRHRPARERHAERHRLRRAGGHIGQRLELHVHRARRRRRRKKRRPAEHLPGIPAALVEILASATGSAPAPARIRLTNLLSCPRRSGVCCFMVIFFPSHGQAGSSLAPGDSQENVLSDASPGRLPGPEACNPPRCHTLPIRLGAHSNPVTRPSWHEKCRALRRDARHPAGTESRVRYSTFAAVPKTYSRRNRRSPRTKMPRKRPNPNSLVVRGCNLGASCLGAKNVSNLSGFVCQEKFDAGRAKKAVFSSS